MTPTSECRRPYQKFFDLFEDDFSKKKIHEFCCNLQQNAKFQKFLHQKEKQSFSISQSREKWPKGAYDLGIIVPKYVCSLYPRYIRNQSKVEGQTMFSISQSREKRPKGAYDLANIVPKYVCSLQPRYRFLKPQNFNFETLEVNLDLLEVLLQKTR